MGTQNINQPERQDVTEIFQEEYPVPAIVVKQDGPVQTQLLPAVKGAAFTQILTDTSYVKILGGPDEKRKQVILTTDGDIFVSFTGNSGSGARVHGGTNVQGILTFTFIGPVWIAAVTGTINVGVIVEYWAD